MLGIEEGADTDASKDPPDAAAANVRQQTMLDSKGVGARQAPMPSADLIERVRNLKDASKIAALERLLNDDAAASGASAQERKTRLAGLEDALSGLKEKVETLDEQALLAELARVTSEYAPELITPPEVIKAARTEILGMSTFLVTGFAYLAGDLTGGVALTGNTRVEPNVARRTLQDGLQERYGDRYVVYVVRDDSEDLEGDLIQADGRPRIALQILPRLVGQPAEQEAWRSAGAFISLIVTALTTLSISALIALPLLPAETITWLANNADAAATDLSSAVPGLADGAFDPAPLVATFSTALAGIVGVAAAHEVAQRAAARLLNVRLTPSIFVPNGSLGVFSSIARPLDSFRNRSSAWNAAAAGPAFGIITAAVLFIYGLKMSSDPSTAASALVPVPPLVFQSSVVLGSIVEATVGPASGSGRVLVHPLLLAGWCGLFTQAFNLLPVGTLKGGRMTEAAYGRTCLNLSSALTYIGLTLGFIGGSLSLPFGLYVILCQRAPWRYTIDKVSPVSSAQEGLTAALVLFALMVLVPVSPDAPELASSIQAGLQGQFLQSAADASSYKI